MPHIPSVERIGQRFNRLTCIEIIGKDTRNHAIFRFRCDCGNEKIAPLANIQSGTVKSCGCLRKEQDERLSKNPRGYRHGMTNTRVWNSWSGMLERCQCPTSKDFSKYGGRGIKVCERWQVFENFLADMGEPPEKYSIDRIDVDGDYCSENCRWADVRTQANNKQNTIYLEYNGKRQSISDWAKETGITYPAIAQRILANWPVERILTTPTRPY